MNSQQLKIKPPEGFEIDQEKSDLSKSIVYFKKSKKKLSYQDVSESLFVNKETWYIGDWGVIKWMTSGIGSYMDKNNSTTREQLESILALNMLCNTAKYLNKDWIPTFSERHYVIFLKNNNVEVRPTNNAGGYGVQSSFVYFPTNDLAQRAIIILGEEIIKKALTLNH